MAECLAKMPLPRMSHPCIVAHHGIYSQGHLRVQTKQHVGTSGYPLKTPTCSPYFEQLVYHLMCTDKLATRSANWSEATDIRLRARSRMPRWLVAEHAPAKLKFQGRSLG